MGMPIRTLTDVLRNIDVIQNSMHPKAFAFVLYKKEHKEFRKYILENLTDFTQSQEKRFCLY
jgi:hypothetical protein